MTGSLLENSAVLFAKFMHNFEKYKEKEYFNMRSNKKEYFNLRSNNKEYFNLRSYKKKYFNLRSRYRGRFMLLFPIYAPHSPLLEKKGLVCPFHQL